MTNVATLMAGAFPDTSLRVDSPRSLTAVPLALLRQPFLAPAPRPPIRALLDLIGFLTLLADPNSALRVLTFEPTLLVVAPRLQLLRVLAPPLYLVPTLQ